MSMGSAKTDEELLGRLYAEHGPALITYARSLLGGDIGRAQDVVQEALLRVWRHPEAVGDGTTLRGWLRTIVRNLVFDEMRARRSRPIELSEANLPAVATEDPAFDRVLLAYELADALSALSGDHRAVIEALYFNELSVVEAADALGVPPGTIKSRAHYALRALRSACQERGVLS